LGREVIQRIMEQTVHTGEPQPLRAFLNPFTMLGSLWSRRDLIWQLARRDIEGRYRAARLGLLWSVLTPLILLGIYTFVFAVVFNFRWDQNNPQESRGHFALTMFCGMLVYTLFAEVATRAPMMVVANPNYVKKVVFPLEVFIVSGLLSAIINMLIGFGVWLIGWLLIKHALPEWTAIWFPVVLLPVCLVTAGVSWVLASIGVFIRDVGHAVTLAVQVLFFATPIFYSIERVPQPYRRVLELNPLTHAIEDMRRVLMWSGSGTPPQPEWSWWLGMTLVSGVIAVIGYAFFMKSRRAFADVV
jgi:lipopolysaccharide transport system permease protein